MAENKDSGSSNTSAGDSELGLKRGNSIAPGYLTFNPNSGTHPAPSTPVKTIINVIPADELTISPKRTRYVDIESEGANDVNKRPNPANLAPPPSERPSLTIIGADEIKPVSLFSNPSSLPNLPNASNALNPSNPQTCNNLTSTMGASQLTSTQASSSQSLFSTLPTPSTFSSLSTPTSTQSKPLFQSTLQSTPTFGSSGFTSSLNLLGSASAPQVPCNTLKYSQKMDLLFGTSPSAVTGTYKSESEKEKVLFDSGKIEFKLENQTALDKVRKDPHGLEWIQVGEEKAKIEKIKKNFRFEELKIKKDLGVKKPFEIQIPDSKGFKVFRVSNEDQGYNPPSFSLEAEFDDLCSPQREAEKKKKIQFCLLPGYKTRPSVDVLNSMSHDELKSVSEFSIMNEFGVIRYKTQVDLTEVDFMNDVVIQKGKILLYKGKKIPQVGSGLNSAAFVILFGCFPNKPIPMSDFADVLKLLCSQFNTTHKGWDKWTGKWSFEVSNFQNFYN